MVEATVRLTDKELRAIVALVYERSGITLHEGKRELIAARFQRRMRELGVRSYSEYLQRVEQDHTGAELVRLLDSIATNHTHFFREAQHFDVLATRVVPEMADRIARGGLSGWCAACSTGEEPYTIVMSLLEAGCDRVRLLASDISTKALATARAGVYRLERVKDVPLPLLKKYFEKGIGQQQGFARVNARVRSFVTYQALNLIEISSLGQRFDFIFCRNVMIYFDKAVQQRVVAMLERHLTPGGYLFIAHSESLTGISHGLQPIMPAVFRRPGG